ncbi:hypothetical protein ACQKNC_21805 [Lysinibacillus sp. NPDC094177]|uniref:hypothetical protein n=1 Tax=Lysinibacillus sp. NPDC094177 TaxID=3390580 RepID=UPI003CFDFDEA
MNLGINVTLEKLINIFETIANNYKIKPPKFDSVIKVILIFAVVYCLITSNFLWGIFFAFLYFSLIAAVELGKSVKSKREFLTNPKPPNNENDEEKAALKFFEKHKLAGGNHAVAELYTNNNLVNTYYASSKLHLGAKVNNKEADQQLINEFSKNFTILAKEDTVVCAENNYDNFYSPLVILYKDLTFINICNTNRLQEFKDKGYTIEKDINYQNYIEYSFERDRNNCTEKKIIHQILNEFRENIDLLKNYDLVLYTEYAPCSSCLGLLQLEIDKFNSIEVYYDDVIFTFSEERLDKNENAYKNFKDLKDSIIKRKSKNNNNKKNEATLKLIEGKTK